MGEAPEYIAGVACNPDGSKDYSRAMYLEPIQDGFRDVRRQTANTVKQRIFSQTELQGISNHLMLLSEARVNIRLRQIAREKSVSAEDVRTEIIDYNRAITREREVGKIRHFHRTSMENFKSIAATGRLLSRPKLKERNPNIDLPIWSSSDAVMMTRDKYDKKGRLIEEGFHEREVVGASGSGVILVLKEEIMDKDDYDNIGSYPTVKDLSLAEYCEVILVTSQVDLKEVQQLLATHGLNIPVSLKSDWKRTT